MKYFYTFIAAAVCVVSFAAITHGALIFEDDFNTAPIGGDPNDGPWDILEFEGPNRTIEILEDTGDILGEGTTNRFVRFFDNDPNSSPPGAILSFGAADAFAAVPVFTLSFTFFEPSGGLDDPLVIRLLADGATAVSGGANFHYDVRLDDGAVDGLTNLYSVGTVHQVDIVVNNQDSNLVYLGGTELIMPRSMDIWIDGGKVLGDDFRTSVGDVTGIGFLTGTTSLQEGYIDNVQVHDEPIILNQIPEPASMVLLFLGFGILVRRSNRLKTGATKSA